MSKQPQLTLAENVKKKLTAEQKVRLNQLVDAFGELGITDNLNYSNSIQAIENGTLTLTSQPSHFIDYVNQFGLTAADLPILRVMIESDKLYFAKDNKAYINLHVANAVSQLGDESGIALLLNQIYKREALDDDWIGELYPFWLSKFGEKLFSYAKQAYGLSKETYVNAVISEAVKMVAKQQADLKPQATAILADWLSNFAHQDKDDNAVLIHDLYELRATEQLPLIKQAFDANKVSLSHMGDYEEIEIMFGLKTERTTPKPEFWDEEDEESFEAFKFLRELVEEQGLLNNLVQKKRAIHPLNQAVQQSFNDN